MKWKSGKAKDKDTGQQVGVQKKQSVSSTTSMPFMRDDNLTFHRFATDVSIASRRPSEDRTFSATPPHIVIGPSVMGSAANNGNGTHHHQHHNTYNHKEQSGVWTTGGGHVGDDSGGGGGVATPTTMTTTATAAGTTSHNSNLYKNSYTTETNDFQYIPSNGSSTRDKSVKSLQNGSTAKLMAQDDDQSNKQSKCSLFRGVIFCLCLNFTYANVVRFPRELERHGIAFLIPYITILLLIGLPIILLEISLGQFLGQGSANAWRASPILKGASMLGRIASWMGTIWTSLQAVIAILYVGELLFNTVPFPQCASNVRLEAISGYKVVAKNGQDCLQQTFLTPVWERSLYFTLLAISLVVLWIVSMICTYSSRTLRRAVFFIGLVSLALLAFQSGWNVADYIHNHNIGMANVTILDAWPFEQTSLADSSIWFDALVQVIFSTGIGMGVWPVVTGKFLYKGDAVRTSMVFMCFNVFIIALSVTFFMTQFSNPVTMNSTITMPELKPLTAIYDAALSDTDPLFNRLIPGLAYILVVLVSVMTIAVGIYTSSRFFSRHPNYILSVCGLVASVSALLAPNYLVARLLDTHIVGVLVICALIFDIVSITWIYGAKNIYTDLEFSIGRPILKSWVLMWCITPVLLTGLLAWWSASFASIDLGITTVPRWSPIIFALIIIVVMACVEVYQQVDYNCCSMIQEAAQSSTDWGPADPIVRHAWKQWRSVCEDTGQKDFTLRRRGTRDYTHSIKKGQYSRGGKFGQHIRKASTGGSSSPNYSGSIFEDSAIEEDVSVKNYAGYQTQATNTTTTTSNGHGPAKPYRYSIDSRKLSTSDTIEKPDNMRQYFYVQPATIPVPDPSDYHNVSKVDILSPAAIGTSTTVLSVSPKRNSFSKNPLARVVESHPSANGQHTQSLEVNYGTASKRDNGGAITADHICWRKFSVNSEEFSTEL